MDKFVIKLKEKFDAPPKLKYTLEYYHAYKQVEALSKKIKRASGEEKKALIAEWRKARQVMLRTPSKSQTDKVIKYTRYADDFLIGVNGSKEECQVIRQQIKEFIADELHMELSEEKTLITHSSKATRFLGYDIHVRRCGEVRRTPRMKLPRRTLNNKVGLLIPFREKIEAFMFGQGIIGRKENGEIEPIKRNNLIQLTPLEIVQTYNSELRGICNYYYMACNFSHLNYFAYLMEYSCLKTLAAKFKTSISRITTRYKDGRGRWGIPYETRAGKKRMYFADYQDSRKKVMKCRDQISDKGLVYNNSCNSLEERLKAKTCELCGRADAEHYELHHIHKVKDLKGKEKWERSMIAKRRKTLVVCVECHKKIHGHSWTKDKSSVNGEPDTLRSVSPVRRGDYANLS